MSRIRNIWQRPKSNVEKSADSTTIPTRQPHQKNDLDAHIEVEDADQDFIFEEDVSEEVEIDPIQALIEAMRDKSGIQPSLRRRQCISVCVNEQDEAVFRASAAKSDMTLSAWAREAMYKHAGVRLHRSKSSKQRK